MNYSLGNMLSGSGGLNADKLALDLRFATDKSLTARRGPTPTFTRASTARFVGSDGLIQSAAINTPRFDHDPVTLACKGLLIEEQRTNLILQSETFQSTWTASQLNTTGTPPYLNVTTAPNGTTTADKLIANTSNSTHQFRQSVTLVSGQPYNFSVYLKAAEYKFVSLAAFGVANGSVDWFSSFDVSTATPTAGFITGFSNSSITSAGNGWFRCEVRFTATASGSLDLRIGGASSTDSTGLVYAGDNTSGFFIWGAQLEAGSSATSYIPTVASSVIRSADVCSITGSDFTGFYNQSEGTFLTQSTKTSTNTNAFIIHASDNSFVNGIDLRYATITSAQSIINVSSSGQVAAFTATVTSGALVKQSMAYKLNDCAYSVNGASAITDTSALIPTVSRINFGTAYTGLPLNGHIASIRYYKKRLANAKLVTLTA